MVQSQYYEIAIEIKSDSDSKNKWDTTNHFLFSSVLLPHAERNAWEIIQELFLPFINYAISFVLEETF